jgi:regulatory protein
MPVITKIERQKRRKNRYNVYIDYEYAFSVHEDLVVKLGLKQEMEVDTGSLRQLVREANLKDGYDMALHYLGYRARSQKEIRDYLIRKGFEEEVTESVIKKLCHHRFIDDEDFARGWVGHRMKGNPMGKRAIQQELIYKGIDADIIQKAMEEIDPMDEETAALKLAQKAYQRCRGMERHKKMAKMGQALMRRGFDWELISRVVSECISQNEE